jgi:fructokinase
MSSALPPCTFDLACFGELLIDFVSTATGPLRNAPGFLKAAGGAPANVAVAAAKLGFRAAFLGAVGEDEFGRFLAEELRSHGVDVTGLTLSTLGSTPIAFVSLREDAERDFQFYWKGTADQCVKPKDLRLDLVRRSRVFHFGSISLIHRATRMNTRQALRAAVESNAYISCDPNLRMRLWPSASVARRTVLGAIGSVHLLKVSAEELEFLTDQADISRGMKALSGYCDALILVTLGAAGAAYRWRRTEGEVPGFKVRAVDTTGAGDGFVAGFLSCLLKNTGDLRKLHPDSEALARWVGFGNAVGALATTRPGAIPAFPDFSEVTALMAKAQVRQSRCASD